MKRPDLLILIVIWEFLTALLALIGVVAIAVFAFPSITFLWGIASAGAIFGLSLATLVLAAYCGLGIAGGIGLITGREWGRIIAIVHAAISILNVPIGTVIGILSIVYLASPEVRDYFVAPKS
jgi:uncharacterized membrane protein (DUF2068 family)